MKTAWTFLICLFACSTVLGAQEAMTGTEFEAATRGKTFIFTHDGEPYGAEQYLFGHRVYWSHLDGQCVGGEWYEEAGNICFTYEDGTGPECWQFFRDGTGFRAQFLGGTDAGPDYSAAWAPTPLTCLGPAFGV